ncbi:MAG: DUF58 domain-containing protein [Rhodothalassiaceae bacterium]
MVGLASPQPIDALPASVLWSSAQALSAAMPPLMAAADRRVAPVGRGLHGRRRAGPGDAFWQYREFREGDRQTDIDWRRSARSPRQLFVRQTEWEAQQTLWFWCDRSPSMTFAGGAKLLKRDRAQILTLAAAHLAAEAGERIGLAEGGGGAGSGAGSGRFGVQRLRLALQEETGSDRPQLARLKPRQHLILISDFLWPEEDLQSLLIRAAAARLQLHLVHILSPAEMQFRYRGRLRLIGLEGEADELVERGEDLAGAYDRTRAAWQHTIAELAKSVGASLIPHHTGRPAAPALLALIRAIEMRRAV